MTDSSTGFNRYRQLFENIAEGDVQAKRELYEIFSRGVRFFLARQLSQAQDVEDELHNVFSTVFNAIRRREICEPERLPGFVLSVVRHRVAARIKEIVAMAQTVELSDSRVGRTSPDPVPGVADVERQHVAMAVLLDMKAKEREILMRFYLREQSPEQICHDMGLTEAEFRQVKARAKARFAGRFHKKEVGTAGLSRLPWRSRANVA